MSPSRAKELPAATRTLLLPLVRILLRNGMSARSLFEIAKQAYVQVAREEFGIRGQHASISRIAILTGLTRKEVQALLDRPTQPADGYDEEYNRAARVMAGWLRDPAFGDGRGHPAPLPMEGRPFLTLSGCPAALMACLGQTESCLHEAAGNASPRHGSCAWSNPRSRSLAVKVK